jgi:hypothetical protein
MPEARQAHTATALDTGKVLVTGGEGSGYLASTRVYDPASNTWTSAGNFASGAGRGYMTATRLSNGKVLVAGGLNSGGAQNKVDVYDPATGTWAVGAVMRTARRSHTATLLPNGKVLVVGGWSGGATVAAELYDPASNTWTATGTLATGRYDHTATLLDGDKVLVVGGRNSAGVVGSAEVYDVATGTWSAASAPGTAREFHTATLLSTGKVLVAGGKNGSALGSAEVYDPTTGTWSATPPMGGARTQHVAVHVDALGKVLVVGGLGATGSSLATAELYEYDACSGVSCNNAPGPCYEAAGTCSNGACSYAPKASGASCDDGNACTGGDACNGAGACTGTATQCESPPGQCYVAAGTCSNGACNYEYKAAGASCDDGDACTVGEECNGAGGCAGTPVSCNTPPGQCYEAAGTCNGGACTYAPKAAGSACNDGNAGTINDACNGAGACTGATACTTPPSACHASPGTYANGTCTYPLKAAGSTCGAGLVCTATGECAPPNGCLIGGVSYAAGAINPSAACQECNPAFSATAWATRPSSAQCRASAGECDAAEFCTGTSTTCPADGFRASGAACSSDGNACTSDVCNGSGTCTHPLAPVGTTCNSPSVGSWGSCGGFSDTCDETGSQSRSVTTYACTSAGACAGSNTSETQSCNRGTSGTACNTTYTNCGSCTGYSDACDESGTQSCTVTQYTCSGGTCNPSSSGSGAQACARDTDGNGCGYSNSCGSCGGFSNYCDTTGTRTCTESSASCSGGTCYSDGSDTYSESCSRSVNTACPGPSYGSWSGCSNSCGASSQSRTVTTYSFNCNTGSCEPSYQTETASCPPQSCPSPSYGSWSSCSGFDNACDTTGIQSRSVTSYYCSGGSCASSTSSETQSCSRSASPPSCSGTTYGAWGACTGGNACGIGKTQSRTVTTSTLNSSTCQCQSTSTTETQSCDSPTPPSCPGPSYGGWSACSGTNACGQGGTQTRSVTTYTPSTSPCQCIASTTTETQSCSGSSGYPYAVCNGVCTTLDDDPYNCGGCGYRCPFKFPVCNQGACEEY